MTLPWEHEVRLYPGLEDDGDLGVMARCTCGEGRQQFPAGTSWTVAEAWAAGHMATHPKPPPPDPEVVRGLAHSILLRGGEIDPAECRFCGGLVRAQGPRPDWAATSPPRNCPALYCPSNPANDDPATIPTHLPTRITERKASE